MLPGMGGPSAEAFGVNQVAPAARAGGGLLSVSPGIAGTTPAQAERRTVHAAPQSTVQVACLRNSWPARGGGSDANENHTHNKSSSTTHPPLANPHYILTQAAAVEAGAASPSPLCQSLTGTKGCC